MTASHLYVGVFLTELQVISGDPSWEENLEFALKFVSKQGGAQAMLAGNNYTYARRYFLENLATHDVFGESLYLDPYVRVACSVSRLFHHWKRASATGKF